MGINIHLHRRPFAQGPHARHQALLLVGHQGSRLGRLGLILERRLLLALALGKHCQPILDCTHGRHVGLHQHVELVPVVLGRQGRQESVVCGHA